MPADLLNQFDPADWPLLDLVFNNVDDSMLDEIAKADYGQDADAHLQALRRVRGGLILDPMDWVPGEVLELIRWSEPEDPSWKPGAVGTRGHWMRLFSCAVLLRATAEPENEGYDCGEDSTIIQMVASAMLLGPEASHAALRFLSWRFQMLDEWRRPHFAVAILLLSMALGRCNEETMRYLMSASYSDEATMTIHELFSYCVNAQTWKETIHRVFVQAPLSLPASLQSELREFARTLTGSANVV